MTVSRSWLPGCSKVRIMASLMAVVALLATVAIAGVTEDLIEAAKRGDLLEVKRLIANGAEVNGKEKEGITALMAASQQGHREVMELLMKAGAK